MANETQNGYIAMYNGKEIEVYASSSYEAQEKAVIVFQKGSRKKVKGYDLIVVLCEKDGEEVVHTATY